MRQSSLRATQPSHGEAEMSEDEEEDGVTDRGVREPNGRGPATPKPPTMRRRTAVAGNTEPLGGKAREKKSRRRGIIACKHGCGFTYVAPEGKRSENDRRLRDQFDYHEVQGCTLLQRLVCPLECTYRGKLLSFAGKKALRNHLKTKSHLARKTELRIGSEELLRLHARHESEYEPTHVHGNPLAGGLRKRADNPRQSQSTMATRQKRRKAEASWEQDDDDDDDDNGNMVVASDGADGDEERPMSASMLAEASAAAKELFMLSAQPLLGLALSQPGVEGVLGDGPAGVVDDRSLQTTSALPFQADALFAPYDETARPLRELSGSEQALVAQYVLDLVQDACARARADDDFSIRSNM